MTTYAPTWLEPADVSAWLRANAPGAGTPEAAELDRVCAATAAYVERCRHEWWFEDPDDPENVVYEPDAETYQGAVMYAARECRRRNNPTGTETFDGGLTFISRYDPDIDRALHTGAYQLPGVG